MQTFRVRVVSTTRHCAAVILLVAIAGLHQILVVRHSLDPWKGGGFAMFSTVRSATQRRVTIGIQTVDGRNFRLLPRDVMQQAYDHPQLATLYHEAVTMPHPIIVHRLASALAGAEWTISDDGVPLIPQHAPRGVPPNDVASDHDLQFQDDLDVWLSTDAQPDMLRYPIEVEEVHVQVWHYSYQGHGAALVAEQIASATADAP